MLKRGMQPVSFSCTNCKRGGRGWERCGVDISYGPQPHDQRVSDSSDSGKSHNQLYSDLESELETEDEDYEDDDNDGYCNTNFDNDGKSSEAQVNAFKKVHGNKERETQANSKPFTKPDKRKSMDGLSDREKRDEEERQEREEDLAREEDFRVLSLRPPPGRCGVCSVQESCGLLSKLSLIILNDEGEDPDRKYRLPYLADGVKNPKKKKKNRKGKRERKGKGSNQATGKVRCTRPEFAVCLLMA